MEVSRPIVRFAATLLGAAILALMPAPSTSAAMLQIVPSSPVLLAGQSETVTVQFTQTPTDPAFQLGAADIEIQFDASRFSVSGVMLGSLDSNNFYFIGGNTVNNTTGYAYTGVVGNGNGYTTISPSSTGSIITFTLTALANAPAGGNPGDINLLANANNANQTLTAVYDNSGSGVGVTLSPTPTNGYDPTIDGTVLVGAAVPEPSSLILMGLGGGLVALVPRFRKKARRPSAA